MMKYATLSTKQDCQAFADAVSTNHGLPSPDRKTLRYSDIYEGVDGWFTCFETPMDDSIVPVGAVVTNEAPPLKHPFK